MRGPQEMATGKLRLAEWLQLHPLTVGRARRAFSTSGVGGELGATTIAGSCRSRKSDIAWGRVGTAEQAGVFAPALNRCELVSAIASRSAGGISGGGPSSAGSFSARDAQNKRLQP